MPDGNAVAYLLSGNKSGGVRVSATCSGVAGTQEVYIAPGRGLGPDLPGRLRAAGAGFRVHDPGLGLRCAGNPVADGTPVRFRADEGMVRGAHGPEVSYCQDGVADAVFTAVPTAGGDGVARITASTAAQRAASWSARARFRWVADSGRAAA